MLPEVVPQSTSGAQGIHQDSKYIRSRYGFSSPAAAGRLACLLSTRMFSIITCKEFTAKGRRQKLSTAPYGMCFPERKQHRSLQRSFSHLSAGAQSADSSSQAPSIPRRGSGASRLPWLCLAAGLDDRRTKRQSSSAGFGSRASGESLFGGASL